MFMIHPASPSIWQETSRLNTYIVNNIGFNLQTNDHIQLIKDCTGQVQKKLLQLQAVDKKIVMGFSLGSGAFLLSWLLPFTTVSIIGFAWGTYQLGLRQQLFAEYKQALQNLANCCTWSLGDIKHAEITKDKTIEEMVKTLAPLTSEKDLKDFIDDDHEDLFIEKVQEVKQTVMIDDFRLNEQQTNLYYHVYGYNQGGLIGILTAMAYALKNGFDNLRGNNQAQQMSM